MSPYYCVQRPISAVLPGSMRRGIGAFLAALWVLAPPGTAVLAQEARPVAGTVVNARTGNPIEGATVVRVGTLYAHVTGADGRFVLGPAPAGAFVIEASAPGFRIVRVEVEGDAELSLALHARTDKLRPSEPALGRRPGMPPWPVTVGNASRRLAGAGASARRSVSVSSQMRGLWGDQVGILVNELQAAPSPFSGVGLYAVVPGDRVDVVPGPYALTWGPGLLSAVRIASATPEAGSVTASYESETGSRNASIAGAAGLGPAMFALRAASLSDHGSRGSRLLPGSGRLRFVGPRLTLSLPGGTELAADAALASEGEAGAPGEEWRGHVSGSLRRARPEGNVQELLLSAGWQRIPGSLDLQRRGVSASVLTARAAALVAPVPQWSMEVGTDLRRTLPLAAGQDWQLVESGLFTRTEIKRSRLVLDATARLDVVHAGLAAQARTRGFASAALVASAPLQDDWVIALGGASAMRTVGVQGSRSRQCAEGLAGCDSGVELSTERVWQADLLVRSGDRPSGTGAGLFVRRLRGQRPLNPRIPDADVDREIILWGAEAWADGPILEPVLWAHGSAAYLAGYDHMAGGPAYGVPPASFAAGLEATAPGVPIGVGGTVHGAARRGQLVTRPVAQEPTPSYITADVWVEADLPGRIRVRVTAVNLANRQYRMEFDNAHSLGFPLRDPGRAWELGLSRGL